MGRRDCCVWNISRYSREHRYPPANDGRFVRPILAAIWRLAVRNGLFRLDVLGASPLLVDCDAGGAWCIRIGSLLPVSNDGHGRSLHGCIQRDRQVFQ